MNDPLDLDALRRQLEGTPFAANLHHFATIGSTNTYALQQAQDNAPTGSVYIADEQTAGRGRGSHAWHSAPGEGLYVSILVRPVLEAQHALWLSLVTGLAVRSAVQHVTQLEPDIRWPNDLLLGDKKFCGILTETAFDGDHLRHAVIGIGINVGHRAFPPELAGIATSLTLASGTQQHRQQVLLQLLHTLHLELRKLERGRTSIDSLTERLTAASTWIRGRRVHVDEAGGYTGITAGLDGRGFLLVDTPQGTRTVLSGGVRAAASE